jgi:hypothetical protein
MNNKDWQPHEDVSRTEYVVGLERKVKELETEQHHKVKEALANSDACWRMEQEVIVRQRDEVASRARRACQILIEEIGADGPTDVDAVAERAAVLIRELRDQVADLQAAAEESEHQMHLRIRSGYDKTIADCWRAKVAEVEAEGDALKARVASMMESMSMSCEEPPANCECAGCSYAREKGGDV